MTSAATESRRALLRTGLATALPLLAGGLSACAGVLTGAPGRPRVPAPTAPLQPPITYVALGASDAVGWGIPTPWRDGWVPVLARQLPQPTRVVNLGAPGITLREALDAALPRALEAQPNLVTVWLVVNDILRGVAIDQYRTGLDRLLGQLRSKAGTAIAVGNVPYLPAHLDPLGLPEIVRRTIAARWNAAVAAVAREHGAVLVDLYARWPLADHPEYIGPDGLHPTVVGYRALADTFLQTLREARLV